jgi:hypothetical protein
MQAVMLDLKSELETLQIDHEEKIKGAHMDMLRASNAKTTPMDSKVNVKSEVAMLTVQATDDNYQLVIEHLRQGRCVAYTNPNRQNALLEFILPTTTLGNARAFCVRTFQRRNDPTPFCPDKRR